MRTAILNTRVVICMAIAFTRLAAQTEPSLPSSETVVELSPFEVRTDRDVGYSASSSLSGSRTDAPLRETAAAVSVLTRDFLDDVGVTDFVSAVEWTTNAVPTYVTGDESRNGGYAMHFRGFTASYPTRNYFKWGMNADGYNTERLEFARGPNGVLFGDGTIGGTPTIWTKRATFGRDQMTVATRVDSFGGYRATADVNRSLGSRVALRTNLMYHKMASWRDTVEWERYGAHLAGTIKLTPKNHFRFEGELGRFDRVTSPTTYYDFSSFWDGSTTYNGTATPPSGRGVSRISTSAYFLDVPAVAELGYADWSRSYRTIGTSVAMEPAARTDIANFPVLPSREFNLQSRDNIAETRYHNYALYLDHRVSRDFFLELAYNQQLIQRDSPVNAAGYREYRIDVNERVPNGQPNPKFLVPFTDQERTRGVSDGTGRDLLLMSAWRHEFSRCFAQANLIAGDMIRTTHELEDRVRRVNPGNPDITAAENIYRRRLYWDEPGKYLFGPLPVIAGYEFAWFPYTADDQTSRTRHVQLITRMQFFEKRLTLLGGARYDDFHRELTSLDGPRDLVTGVRTYTPRVTDDANPTSYNWGGVYFWRPWLGLSANYSETFGPPGSGPNLIDGKSPGISRSRGFDFGLKLEWFDRRLSGTLNYYDTELVNLVNASGFENQNQTQINRIWTNLGRNDLATVNYRDSQDYEGSGYEIDLVANPSRNLRLMLNWAWPTTKGVHLRPGLRRYFEQHLAVWQAGANDPRNPNRAQIQSDIDTIATTLDSSVPGVRLNNSLNYMGNFYATYSFREGWAKNLAVGGGANFRGKNKIGATLGEPFGYIMQEGYSLISAHLAYRHRIGNVPVRLQVNATNLLDNDDLIYTNVVTFRPGNVTANPQVTIPGQFRYLEPRKIAFSVTLEL